MPTHSESLNMLQKGFLFPSCKPGSVGSVMCFIPIKAKTFEAKTQNVLQGRGMERECV